MLYIHSMLLLSVPRSILQGTEVRHLIYNVSTQVGKLRKRHRTHTVNHTARAHTRKKGRNTIKTSGVHKQFKAPSLDMFYSIYCLI